MARVEKRFGERNNDDIIRDILREYSSRENPISASGIIDKAKKRGTEIGRTVIKGFANRMEAEEYKTEEECDEIIKKCRGDEREIIFVKKGQNGRTIGYWMMEMLSESEWMFLMDSVINSKILTQKEADNLAKRITFLAGKRFSELTQYRHRMENQPYFVGDDDIDGKAGYIESRVLKQVYLIRQAIKQGKKVKFNLCVYDYGKQNIRLVPYGRHGMYFQKRQRNIKKMSIEFVHHLISYSRMGGTICWVQIWKRKDAQICNTNYIE